MEMDYIDISRLIFLHIQGNLSPEEESVLESWVNEKEDRRLFMKEIEERNHLGKDLRLYASFDVKEGWRRVRRRTLRHKVALRTKILNWAAIFLLGIGCMLFYFLCFDRAEEHKYSLAEIAPGSNRAELILENGQIVDLSGNRKEKLQGKNWSVEEIGKLHYKTTDVKVGQHKEWHTLRVPLGGEYHLMLEDGTYICLNSGSELSYPVSFDEKGVRKVILSGEAYFNVNSDSTRIFIVETERMEVQVFGTVFDVAAYPDEPLVYTTLLSGCVEVKNKSIGGKVTLEPGWQAVCKDDILTTSEVDTTVYIAWMSGRFAFKSESLEQVLRKLGRWYNVDFEIVDESIRKKRFTGNVSRYEEISRILDMLALTTDINFELEGNKIIVTKCKH